ncbi:MAG TPA: SDR family NAD(P)-dependent oxidoreductase [Saprospiraceae bacterium]|nr:SDR family NAD(P)-dependent oxidoreductase [Saprospiraceae bacterium]HMQ83439.1 SDR family NAD(P)-dependent oxidoreductase [Saprospiraceae bacterium]
MQKNILITGASRGIGHDLAKILSDQGHRVLAISRNSELLTQLQQSCSGFVDCLATDLSRPEAIELILEKVSLFGHLDLVVNNAGYLYKEQFENIPDERWQYLFEVNVFGPVRLLRGLLPYLEKSTQAHVVNISSMGGFQGSSKFPGLSAYSASKAALANLTECLAEEWKNKGIAVNCLALGAVQTAMLAEAFPGYQAPVDSPTMAQYIADFALEGHRLFNGKILPVSVSTP